MINYVGIVLVVILIGVFVWFLKVIQAGRSQRIGFLCKFAKLFNTDLEQVDKSSNFFGASYKITFIYNERKYEYYDREISIPFGNPHYYSHEGFLITKVQNNLTLKLLGNIGNSIGKIVTDVVSNTLFEGCIEISDKRDLPNQIKNLRIYTNDESKARCFLSAPEVINVLSSYTNKTWYSQAIPVSIWIEAGVIKLRFSSDLKPYLQELYGNLDLIKGHLSQIQILANKLGQIK